MSDDEKTAMRREAEVVAWPADLLSEPEYPSLEVTQIDLACDAIVFQAPFDPETF